MAPVLATRLFSIAVARLLVGVEGVESQEVTVHLRGNRVRYNQGGGR